MSEFGGQQPEYLNESELAERRLPQLEESLRTGEYGGRPVRFLVGTELEFYIVGTSDVSPLPAEEYNRLRNEAQQDILQLVPANAAEARKQQEWLANIDNFTVADFVNYELYKRFSTPTLGETAPPKGASYDTLATQYGSPNNWLEFRFGNAGLQAGYYDNKGVTEIRLSPCAPSEMPYRERIVLNELVSIAAKHGCVPGYSGEHISRHINLSMYAEDEPQADESGAPEWLPVIGNAPDKFDATLDIMSGVSAAIEEGAWMNELSAEETLIFGENASGRWFIGTERVSVRIKDGYAETREKHLHSSVAQGSLWLMAAMSYGYEKGQANIGEAGHTPAKLILKNFVKRLDNFDKDTDLQLHRLIENIAYDATLKPVLHSAYQRANALAAELFGEDVLSSEQADFIAAGIAGGLELKPDGTPHLDADEFVDAYVRAWALYDEAFETKIPLDFSLGAAASIIQKHLNRNAIKVSIGPAIFADPKWPRLLPADWHERWKASPIMQRAYGDANQAHADRLYTIAEAHYKPLPSDDFLLRYSIMKQWQEARKKRFQQITPEKIGQFTIKVDTV
ncbi:MAG TPA: hypothetical protein VLG16_02715 [Candidatus Saccharimonadales bacterium]|nr:hypothetical protein [Candidatus Saccharimonadales bacterium]